LLIVRTELMGWHGARSRQGTRALRAPQGGFIP
jgi:hypothetical protein